MGAKATFDAIARVITLTEAPAGGKVTVDVKVDLYSDAKEDWLADPVLNRHRFPFRVVGGDDLPGTKKLGAHFFLRNDLGWRIRPYDQDHELTLDGNLWPEDDSLALFLPTVGARTVTIFIDRSSLTLVESTGVSGLTAAESTRLTEVHQVYGLDAGNPVIHRKSPARIEFGGETLDLTEDQDGNVTVQRQ